MPSFTNLLSQKNEPAPRKYRQIGGKGGNNNQADFRTLRESVKRVLYKNKKQSHRKQEDRSEGRKWNSQNSKATNFTDRHKGDKKLGKGGRGTRKIKTRVEEGKGNGDGLLWPCVHRLGEGYL